ncbi:efflux transporter outer membrane subunit [Paraburkholderia sp. GAS42]|uniref:efflux transporter outer membrane subunit n=1 Tax=Paraburkholderia sp. GAS42 TaxID=3035135 RepID=UPI003D1B736B
MPGRRRVRRDAAAGWIGFAFAVCAGLNACSVQSAYVQPALQVHPAWANQMHDASASSPPEDKWWTALGDPVLDDLIEAAFDSSPSLALAAAHVAEARAMLGAQTAQSRPHVSFNASVERARVQGGGGGIGGSTGGGGSTVVGSAVTGGPTFAWEIDLFGRLRLAQSAASSRLAARTADAAAARLLLAAQVAGTVTSLRACRVVLNVRRHDIESQQRDLVLTRQRVALGFAAPVDESRALSSLADAQTSLIAQDELCVQDTDALVQLTGLSADDLNARAGAASLLHGQRNDGSFAFREMPEAVLALPASVLASHPAVIAAEHEMAATYAEIGVARANRLPVLNLTAVLSGNWISASGSTLSWLAWSLLPAVSGPIFDAGAGSASVDAASARYLAALATLRETVRTTAQDVENALSAQAHARQRLTAAAHARDAAQATLDATESQWRAGAVSLFVLEDTRRKREAADETAVDAARASVQAWVDVIRASGNAATFAASHSQPD